MPWTNKQREVQNMSQINRTSPASVTLSIVLLLSLFLLVGCGDKNPQSDFDPISGQHPVDWLPSEHKTEAKVHMEDLCPLSRRRFWRGDFEGRLHPVPPRQPELRTPQPVGTLRVCPARELCQTARSSRCHLRQCPLSRDEPGRRRRDRTILCAVPYERRQIFGASP